MRFRTDVEAPESDATRLLQLLLGFNDSYTQVSCLNSAIWAIPGLKDCLEKYCGALGRQFLVLAFLYLYFWFFPLPLGRRRGCS